MPKNAIGNIDENRGSGVASLRQKCKEGQESIADTAHDKGGQNHSGENGGESILHTHIQKSGDESTCPCACSGQRDSYEQKKAKGGIPQYLIGLGVRFVLQPLSDFTERIGGVHPGQNLADEQKNKRNGYHVSEETDKEVGNPGHTRGGTQGNGTAQLDEGNHGTEEDVKIFFEKLQHSRIYAGDVSEDISRPFHEL